MSQYRRFKNAIVVLSGKETEKNETEEIQFGNVNPNLSSRLGQWNSKDTRSRLRSVAEKRLRANALGPKISTPSTSIKSTTVVQSRGEEGLLTEGSEPELTQIRTQTSRSIVMRRSRIKQQKEGSPYFKHLYVVDLQT